MADLSPRQNIATCAARLCMAAKIVACFILRAAQTLRGVSRGIWLEASPTTK